jgi:hypothetical protein
MGRSADGGSGWTFNGRNPIFVPPERYPYCNIPRLRRHTPETHLRDAGRGKPTETAFGSRKERNRPIGLEGGREGDQPGHGASRGPCPGGRPQHRFGARVRGGSGPRVETSSRTGQVCLSDGKHNPETAKHDDFDPGSISAPLQAGRLALQARSGAASKGATFIAPAAKRLPWPAPARR